MRSETEADPAQDLELHTAKTTRHSLIVIIVTPDARRGRCRAYVEAEQKPLCVSRQPFLDAARKLLARGHDRRTMLVMRWQGAKDWALRGPLGVAAGLTIDEHNGTVFARCKPLSRSAGSSRISKSGREVSTTGGADKAVA